MDIVFDLLGLLACLILLGNAQLYAASVLIHHTGHGHGAKPRWFGKLLAELAGILTLRQPLEVYRATHGLHHSESRFARAGLDPDASFVQKQGFQLGDSVWLSYWKLLRLVLNVKLQYKLIKKRLTLTFAWQDGRLRNVAAGIIWTVILWTVIHLAVFLPFVILLILAMVVGNFSAIAELLSRHKWFVEIDDETNRQWVLSHARFYGALPPVEGASVGAWLLWFSKILQAVIERSLVGAGDLGWHIAHHVRWDLDEYHGQPAWCNPVYAYYPYLDQLGSEKIYWSTAEAIDAWFLAMEEQDISDDK
ncbi:hypothetical protein [Methylomonas sp. HYX-M1]|uniref:hypothetical protein n=1 Tax=Methylomonas sp. HYX-M1 TaxID=3139307 RepID=UPI00345BDC46